MCGIAGYAGPRPAYPFIVQALKEMEYRGYDSFGVAVYPGNAEAPQIMKGTGSPSRGLSPGYLEGNIGIGHTRWATHGAVTAENTHPIRGGKPGGPSWYVVHNGIIENHKELRQELQGWGYVFKTETDTEVIGHLFDWFYTTGNLDLMGTVREVCRHLKGQYAFAVLSPYHVDELAIACKGSPLLLTQEGHVASDLRALSSVASMAYRMSDGAMATIRFSGDKPNIKVFDSLVIYGLWWLHKVPVPDKESTDLAGCDHYMLKEIYEQPTLLRNGWLPKMAPIPFGKPDRVVLFGCGSSYHAALLGRKYIEDLVGRPCQVEYATELASEWFYESPNTLWIGLTQSGETKDTLRALERLSKEPGKYPLNLRVITNNRWSSAANLAKVIHLDCGFEQGVAATKTFTMQVARLLQLACMMGGIRTNIVEMMRTNLPDAVLMLLQNEGQIKKVAEYVGQWHNILYLARGLLYPIAMEGALKMKEVAYRHAEAMHASEMKHGPIALIDDKTLCIFLLTKQDEPEIRRVAANIEEVQARGGKVVVFADEDSAKALGTGEAIVVILPSVSKLLQPILVNIALQLLSYHVAVRDGLDVDRPRNLAKSVTVE
jgi:glucosamine--fructose-6-phosphate aminotransferase (isomerizing)